MTVDLIPGTALPYHVGPGGAQPEGRGTVELTPARMPVEMIERPFSDPDFASAAERVIAAAAIRAFDTGKKLERTIYQRSAGVCDGTTGNLVRELFLVPQGLEGHVANVTLDAPGSATITPSAPFSNASSFAFLAVSQGSTGDTGVATTVTSLRRGLVAFAPTSSAGPFIPGQWTFNDTNAPVVWGGQALYLVISGGSVAGLQSLSIQITYRIDLYSRASAGTNIGGS